MKVRGMLLGMIIGAVLIMAQVSVSNAATYSGAWLPNDETDMFAVQFMNEPTLTPDSFYMYDFGNQNIAVDLELFSGLRKYDYETVHFTKEDNIYYAGLTLGAKTLNLGTNLHFGFYFKKADTLFLEYDVQLGHGGDEFILTCENINITVLAHDISQVPIPASALLLGSGIVGLIGFGKRMRKRVS